MDVEYARLARDLPLPKGATIAPKANVIENAAAEYISPNAGGSGAQVRISFFYICFKIFLVQPYLQITEFHLNM